MKTTLKDIRDFYATDLTRASEERLKALPPLRQVAYSTGTYGVTGGVWVDDKGNFYKVTSRNNALFYLL